MDCEFLKKCCDTLTDENRRLQKELQELKAVKVAQLFYMHMPAATLTMCPSCERVGGAAVGDGGNSKNPFSILATSNPHLYNPFSNPAACWSLSLFVKRKENRPTTLINPSIFWLKGLACSEIKISVINYFVENLSKNIIL